MGSEWHYFVVYRPLDGEHEVYKARIKILNPIAIKCKPEFVGEYVKNTGNLDAESYMVDMLCDEGVIYHGDYSCKREPCVRYVKKVPTEIVNAVCLSPAYAANANFIAKRNADLRGVEIEAFRCGETYDIVK